MRIRMKTAFRKMPSNVLTALFGIIEHQELNPKFDNFSELPPSEKRRLLRWLKTVEAWLKDEGLIFENLVAVLAVPNRGKRPTLVFAFDDRNESKAESVREISLSL